VSEPLGLDSITFDTFDWEPVHADELMRVWQGDGIVLVENFFDLPPDIPSLEVSAPRAAHEEAAHERPRWRSTVLLATAKLHAFRRGPGVSNGLGRRSTSEGP
jgi:hypothetical protein